MSIDHVGHRQRVKNKFLKSDHEKYEDYELLELLLFHVIPRRDVKPLAKKLLRCFSSIKALVACDICNLLEVEGTNKNIYVILALIKELSRRMLLDNDVKKENILSAWSAVVDYLKSHMGNNAVEQFRILFLNKKNVLIADEVQTLGTIDQTAIYPREVIRKSLFYGAGALILVHNHPSGNPKPSKADIELTKIIVKACAPFDISVHDHVIIGKNKIFSFKSNLLL